MNPEHYLPLMASITGILMIFVSYLVVRSKDLVYASTSLAALGILNALMVGLLGYYIIAIFLTIVYVGAAVMFIIVTVSMLGGRSKEVRDEYKGLFTGASIATVALLIVSSLGAYLGYTRPASIPASNVADSLLTGYTPVIALIFVALAATLIEAIAIARRG